ncbi:PAS domain-containing sensor histidine kinase [Aquimarina sp. RZ0]|uniref:PAS domain-containing sensor histidine kinase n=1 Tax=Aquimarina sp. RZ0 TaxID=2607730 RepID=UPI0011F3F5AF|nr:PAS domain-containing sensor histidine kinase [Aquimarina sp. RZ0]KAA1244464.1 PAS domain-containing protein [Aquimarina sp. RZ0]
MAFTGKEFEILAEKTSLFLVLMDKEGKVRKVNKRCESLFLLPKDQIIGQSMFQRILDEDESDFRKLISALSDNSPQANRIYRFATLVSDAILSIKFDFVYHHDQMIYATGIDVTEENEEHNLLVTLSKLTKTGVWHFDPLKEKLYFSKECYHLHDIAPNTPIALETAIKYYHPASRQKVEKHIDSLINDKKPFDFIERLISEKGIEKWVRVIGKPVLHKNKVIFINGSYSDITNRYKYIKQLKHNEETKNLALKGIRSGLFDYNIENNSIFYSTDFKKMLGLPLDKDFVPEEIFREMIHPDDVDDSIQRHTDNLKKDGYHYHNFYRLKHLNEGYRHYEVYGYRKKNKNGETIRMIGNLIDIHQKKLNEQTIVENQSRLLAMVNNSFAYTVLLNTKGEILMADENSLYIIKRDFKVDPTTTPSLFINVMPVNFKNTFAHEFNEALKGISVKKEIERITIKGTTQWLESKYTPIFDDQNKVNAVLISFHDITESKLAELAIKEAHIKEQELSSLKSNILSNFSHEIRTPLNGIMTISNLLLSGEEKQQERKKLLKYLDQSKDRLLKTINNLSLYSEFETIRKNLDYIEADMNYTVETSYREYRHLAKSKGLTYLLKLDESCPIATIDENIFRTALNNIIHNAIKYTDTGKIVVKLKAIKEYIHITVKDTGIGIDRKNLKKIFDPFIQESIGLNRKYEGIGIGLTLSKKYIEILGGIITIKSETLKGTKCTIKIPRVL